MLTSIVNFISFIFHEISNFFVGLINLVTGLFNVYLFTAELTAILPPILGICITVTISAMIIKFVVGRQ